MEILSPGLSQEKDEFYASWATGRNRNSLTTSLLYGMDKGRKEKDSRNHKLH